ncbi:MAG: hypothetical protein IPJ59_36375 [Nannocystis sp.]|nr:transporter associated domain-containing protein [Nannocystis sp.]MBK7830611.1 hypothetical protein [Nannocystis sp.]
MVPRRAVRVLAPGPTWSTARRACAASRSSWASTCRSSRGVGSVGDLLTHLAGQIPTTGSVFLWEGLRFPVLEAYARHLVRVRVDRTSDESTIADG